MKITLAAVLLLLALMAPACSPTSSTQPCHRYEAAAMVPENDFTAMIPSQGYSVIAAPPERLDLALTIIRPAKGPVTLVHVIGGEEIERWDLVIPASKRPIALCRISPLTKLSTCAATLSELPHPPGGYFYLLPRDNRVLDAGISFYTCD